jgi:hypothetical protein
MKKKPDKVKKSTVDLETENAAWESKKVAELGKGLFLRSQGLRIELETSMEGRAITFDLKRERYHG